MKMYKFILYVILVLFFTASANATDITGKWIMTTPRPNGAIHQTMNFEIIGEITSGPATGDLKLAGTIETPFGPFDIFGEVDGNDVFFASYQNYKPDAMSLHIWYGQIVSDNEIQFRQTFGNTGQDIGPGPGGQAPQATGYVPNMDPDWEGRSSSFVSKFSAYRTTVENPTLPGGRRGGPPPPEGGTP